MDIKSSDVNTLVTATFKGSDIITVGDERMHLDLLRSIDGEFLLGRGESVINLGSEVEVVIVGAYHANEYYAGKKKSDCPIPDCSAVSLTFNDGVGTEYGPCKTCQLSGVCNGSCASIRKLVCIVHDGDNFRAAVLTQPVTGDFSHSFLKVRTVLKDQLHSSTITLKHSDTKKCYVDFGNSTENNIEISLASFRNKVYKIVMDRHVRHRESKLAGVRVSALKRAQPMYVRFFMTLKIMAARIRRRIGVIKQI